MQTELQRRWFTSGLRARKGEIQSDGGASQSRSGSEAENSILTDADERCRDAQCRNYDEPVEGVTVAASGRCNREIWI